MWYRFLAVMLVFASQLAAEQVRFCVSDLAAGRCDRAAQTDGPDPLCLLMAEYPGGDLGLARQAGEDALQQTRDPAARACLHETLGNIAYYAGDPGTAADRFSAALNGARAAADVEAQAYRLKDLGVAYRALGRFDEALWAFEEVRSIFPEWRSEPLAVALLGNLGSLYERLGAAEIALGMYEEALNLAEREVPPQQTYDILTRIGTLHAIRGADAEAVRVMERAAAEAEIHAEGRAPAWVYGELGNVYKGAGLDNQARWAFTRSLDAAQASGDLMNQMASLVDLGELDIDTDRDTAADLFRRALDMAPTAPDGPDWRAAAGLATVHRLQGRLDQAIDGYHDAVERIELSRGSLLAWQDRTAFAGSTRPVYGALVTCLAERGGSGDDVVAFSVADRARARAVIEELNRARINLESELEPQLRVRWSALKSERVALLHRLTSQGLVGGEREAVVAAIDQLDLRREELVAAVHRGVGGSTVFPAPVNAQAVAAQLPENSALVAYTVTQEKTVAFVVNRRGLRVQVLDLSEGDVERRVPLYLEKLRRGGTGWLTASRWLHERLVAPFAHELAGIESLIVIIDGPLRSLPFETLIDRANGRPLVESYVISYSPSVAVLAELERRTGDRARPTSALVITDARWLESEGRQVVSAALYRDEGLELGHLPGSAAEAEAVTAYTGQESVVLSGRQATEAEIKQADLARFAVLHFATHALISERRPQRSALLLAPGGSEDGFLQAREISNLSLAARLVVLSACRSVVVGGGSGSVHSLARSFLHAGAASVVGSLWEVDDRRTADFMDRFYGFVADGDDTATALCQAKRAVLKRHGLDEPWQWAAFVLIGEPTVTLELDGAPPWHGWPVQPMMLVVCGLVLGGLSFRD